ncbi:MAG TPA: peptidylprolyl isomerase [Flavobacteriales bacterium]|nr:peptidylprolyl isomerase [Flavobacteriales bacterium]HCL46678.1 peptidylprolyl isomerase [Flavobacteriales bacterium]
MGRQSAMNVRAGYVCGMKEFWLWGALALVWGCGSSEPVKEDMPAPQPPEKVVEVDERIRRLVASDFPTLTDDNALSFLTEWGQTQTENRIALDTKHGRIVVEVFEDVPVHRANFLYKVYRRYFDPAEFTRVVPDFVVQGGNSEEERPQQLRFLIGQHTLPAEFQDDKIHVRGALAMSRSYSENPDKRSSGYDFYIVTGRTIGPQELGRIQQDKGRRYTEAQARAYATQGGAPHLDGEHTVFGRVVEGMDVVDRLAATPRDGSDWPVERLEVRMNVLSEAPALAL